MSGPERSDAPPIAFETLGAGPEALLLPALSSIATRQEMRPLAERLAGRLRCVMPDWPGFGSPLPVGAPLEPATMDAFLDRLLDGVASGPAIGIAAGHGAAYLVKAARRHPRRFTRLVLVAPTWRGPLPTMFGGRREAFCGKVRAALELPVVGPALFRLNLSRPVVGWMMREHVYADPARVTPAVLSAKLGVAHRPGARFGTAAFVTGGLDAVRSRAAFLALFDAELPPILMLRPRGAPARSAAEMDALTASGRVRTVEVDGALAPHEEVPDAVAEAILADLPAGR